MAKELKVGQQYRTHPWSHQPGGTTVYVLSRGSKNPMIYDRVKDIQAYAAATKSKNPGCEVYVLDIDDNKIIL